MAEPHGAELTSARTPLEAQLAELFAEILGVERVGVHEDFFERGGHSLLAIHLVMQIRDRFGGDMSVGDLIDHPTVAELAELLEQGPA